ncbi:hypothetical protein ILUMI_24166 [Ignelater luminosus]|uniref:Integrase catalytic domain-containing protein n=1 Tax=Ignelater luminosus TaxID=2038154 RepID=A0A8K0CCI2_IGNLU|nr:hypothetical protein ILUMI_24166 [Ignelater luminosus]
MYKTLTLRFNNSCTTQNLNSRSHQIFSTMPTFGVKPRQAPAEYIYHQVFAKMSSNEHITPRDSNHYVCPFLHFMPPGEDRPPHKSPAWHFHGPNARFAHVHMDIVGPLSPSADKQYILTLIDRFSKWPEAIPILDITAQTCSQAFCDHWVARFGVAS